MNGGYNGLKRRNDDPCPVCRESYDRYIPADSSMNLEDAASHVCISVNNGAYASGGYVHYDS